MSDPAHALAEIRNALVDIVENLEIADGLDDSFARVDTADTASGLLASELPSTSTGSSERHDSHVLARSQQSRDAHRTAVLCVPGRGSFDEVTTAIAAQLLGRHGFAPLTATHSGYRSASADEPSFKDASIICIVSLDAPESPPYLRNMLRRTREWRPRATLVVGVGEAPEPSIELDAAGALHASPTFRAMIEACHAATSVQAMRQPSQTAGAN